MQDVLCEDEGYKLTHGYLKPGINHYFPRFLLRDNSKRKKRLRNKIAKKYIGALEASNIFIGEQALIDGGVPLFVDHNAFANEQEYKRFCNSRNDPREVFEVKEGCLINSIPIVRTNSVGIIDENTVIETVGYESVKGVI